MQVSIEDRHLIVEKTFCEKLRPRTIARQLGCSIRTVERVMQQFILEHKLEPHARSGRPSQMDSAMTTALDKIVTRNPSASSSALQTMLLARTGRGVSARTVRRARRTLGYHPVHASLKPRLTEQHAEQRLRFCRAHVGDGLRHMVFMDEMGVDIDHNNDIYWIKPGQKRPIRYRFPQKVKVNIWGAIWYNGRTSLHFTKKTFNSNHYIHVLQGHLRPHLPLQRKEFIHDGVPWHWTHAVQTGVTTTEFL